MTISSWDDFEQRLSSEESLHADSEPLDWPPSQALLLRLAERNANTLAAIAALEERRADIGEDDSPLMQEMLRLDAKLTAMVDIVNHLLVPAGTLPPRQSLRFNAAGALLPAMLVPPGGAVLLRLRFDACRSLPLELAARAERQLDDGRVFVAFAPQGEMLGDAIERLVFRHHRRKVAEARQLAG
ncbi:PilZ domain-containing protein [Rhodanobacter denitrificans]|uniref:PilZ domain-containing protein n=2 Tax=Rhodanobacter denitrificans TaxID=666685 RepID=A0A368KEP1_9GAMM|nr:PilZ domain-containing protein [Rhodanobacter denitrificans]